MKEPNLAAQERADTTDAPTAKYDSRNRITNRNQTSVMTDESDEQNSSNGRMARRQLLGAAAVAVGVTASLDATAASESDSVENSIEWKASGVWEDHLLPARNALISDPVDIEEAEEELHEAVQKLKALEVDDAN